MMDRNPIPARASAKGRSSAPGPDSPPARKRNVGFAEMLDSVPGAWFFTRRDGSFAYVNLGACEALGYSRQQLLHSTVFDIDPTMNAETWSRHWESTVPSQSGTLRTVHRRQDGTEYPIEIRSLKIELDGEHLSASYSVDLTVSEQTRAALAASESRLQRLLEHLPDLVFRLRLEPRPLLEFVSPSSRPLLGYWPSELIGDESAVSRIVHENDLQLFLSLHQMPPRAGRKIRFLTRDGQIVWMELRVAPVGEGVVGVVEGVARDVTQSHHAELQSRRLLAAIEQAAEAVVVTDSVGVVEYVNPAYRHTSGIAEGDALGKPWRELEVRRDRAFLRRLSAALGKGEVWQGRIQSVRTSGVSFDEDATLAPLRDELGQTVGCVAVKRDVTEQLALEEQLHQAQKLEAVGQLAGGIAHDFNNLLHVIAGYTHMMQAMSLEGFGRAGELKEMLGEVSKSTDRAASLVRQLLAFSRKGDAEFSELALDELLASLHPTLQGLLGEHIQLVVGGDAGKATIFGNRAQLEQMITNLCINARDAMRPGGYLHISLDATSRGELPTLLRGHDEAVWVRLSVRDDGSGMTRDVQRRLYEPFFTTKQPREGVGLGLATVYAIVQSHQGFIESRSARGKGTTFNVYLQRLGDAARPSLRPSSRPRVEGRGRVALVAEDEPAVLQLTSCYLRQAGFEVILATNGPEAEALLDERGGELALAVLDAVMPGFGGQGVHQAMKARSISAPVIFVTGYDYQTLAGALGDERVAMLRKPFGQSELLDEVGRLLGDPA
jgi:two-component system, cell cycle sensor histidine kinase and response regulator CckA